MQPSPASPSTETPTGEGHEGVPGFREFITTLDRRKLLMRVGKQMNWRSELGELSSRSESPMLFESIRDYPGWRLFTCGLASPACFALALGLDPGTTWRDLVQTARERFNHPH